MRLGHILKLVRTQRGLNQQQTADLLGISQNYLSLIESERKQPSVNKIADIAKSLNISKDALLFVSSGVPSELDSEDKTDYQRLQKNIVSLLLFELTGDLKKGEGRCLCLK